jgi:soluble lytic murein transglycosylase-like protein
MRFSRCNNPVIASLGILLAWSIDVEISQASVQFAGPTANGLATGVGSSHITEPPTARRTHARISVSEFDRHITSAATQYGVSHDLIRAVIEAESAFNPSALSDRGACGLMQLMPGTASRFGVVDCFDARENIHGGTRYLKLLLARFDGSIPLSVAAYNAGEGAVARHGGIPPYRQTRAYVRKVEELLAE